MLDARQPTLRGAPLGTPQPPIPQQLGTPRGTPIADLAANPAPERPAERPAERLGRASSTLDLVPRFGESERGDLVPRFADSERSEAEEGREEGGDRVSEREAARREVLRHCVSSKSLGRASSWGSDLAT